MWATRYSERGERSCTRSIDFYAWPKTRFQPRMRGIRKCPVLQMWATGLVRGVCARARVRWYFMRGRNGSNGHACEISNQLFYLFTFYGVVVLLREMQHHCYRKRCSIVTENAVLVVIVYTYKVFSLL